MTVSPEYSEEERMRQQAQGGRPADRADLAGREIQEHDRAEQELERLEPEDNEAHAPGQVCERCGAVITASDDVRRLPGGRWIHEVCPVISAGGRLTTLGQKAVDDLDGPGRPSSRMSWR